MNDYNRKFDAIDIMPKYLTMINSELVKVTTYLRDGVKVAIVMEDKELSEKLATFYIQADELSKDFQKLSGMIAQRRNNVYTNKN